MKPLCRWACLLLLLLATSRAVAQAASGGLGGPGGDRFVISLLTVSPGEELEERLGHSAIAVEDRQTGSELAYNFGSFGATDQLVYRFLHKQLPFWVSSLNAGEVAMRYRQRQIRVQQLALAPAQAARLAELLAARVLPANRGLDYDLFTANCVAPIRDVLDQALDGELHRQTDRPAAQSYRQAIHAGFVAEPLLATFSDLIFGPYVDRPRQRWDLLFTPDALHDAVAELRRDGSPAAPSLVRSEKRWRGDAYSPPLPLPSPQTLAALLGLLGLLGGLLLLRRRSGRLLGAVAALLALLSGLFGVAVYYLDWMPHLSVQHNANRYLFSPLELLAVPLLLRLGSGRLGARPIGWLLLLLGGTTLIAGGHALSGHLLGPAMGGGLGALLGCPQQHGGVVGWALGGRLALALAIGLLLAHRPAGRPAVSGTPAQR